MSKDPLGNGLWFNVRRGWITYAVVGIIVVGLVAFNLNEQRFAWADGRPVEAKIVSLSTSFRASRPDWNGWATVVAMTPTGETGIIRVPPDRIRGCKVGDPIDAEQVGKRLRLDPWPCNREAGSS